MIHNNEMSDDMRKRRETALNAAFELFSESTIEKIKMEEIAKKAGIGVASLYRYFGTKLALCVELGAYKWREYTEDMEKAYKARGGADMSALEEFEFHLNCYLDLYENHKPLLRFNNNFDLYVMHENATAEDMADYYDSVGYFAKKFHILYERGVSDHTIRTDLSEQELFFYVMYTMLPTAQKLAYGLVYPRDTEQVSMKILQRQKEMFIAYVKVK